ncbi:site-specific tyrosine recombinase XerD [compost metagenome]
MSVKVIYRPVSKNSKEGYLKIRITENRVSRINTLGIKIEGKNWLESKQRVSKNETNYEAINEKISEVLKDLSKHDNNIQVLTTTNKTILQFYQETINITLNEGTKLKYINIRNKFIKYLGSIGFTDLKFNQLTNQRVREFHKYIIEIGNSIDTANYNLKSFKAIITKAKRANIVTYITDPFDNIQYKYSAKKYKALTSNDIKNLITTNFIDTRKPTYNNKNINLNEIRNIFLFQFFTQGLRSSDVILLRWSNFQIKNDSIKIDYVMFKTKKGMSLNLTYMALKMLNYPLFRIYPNLENEINEIELRKLDYIEQIEKFSKLLTEDNQEMTQVIQLAATIDENYKAKAKAIANKQASNISYKGIIAMNKELLKEVEVNVFRKYIEAIQGVIMSEKKNDFVFYFLDNKDFSNFKDNTFDNLTALQYKRLTGTRSYYNQLLKLIQSQAKIQPTLTSHIARHTYTQLLLENEASISDISYSLGHSHLSTTQTYISKLPSNNITTINTLLSDQFS